MTVQADAGGLRVAITESLCHSVVPIRQIMNRQAYLFFASSHLTTPALIRARRHFLTPLPANSHTTLPPAP